MTRIKMHISKAKLPFYPPREVKCMLQNGVSTPNTFPRPYHNFEPIPLVVRSMVLPRNDAIYMVPRPLQKLGGNSPLCP